MLLNKNEKNKMNVYNLTWPIFIETLLFMLLGSIDTVMLSQYSDNAVAAVGVSNQLMWMMNIMFGIIAGGTAILVAQYLGAGDKKMASKVISVSLVVNVVFGLILSLSVIIFGKYLLEALNIRAELMNYAIQYLYIVGGFLFVQALIMTISAAIRSYGYTKISMFVTLGMNVINLIGDYLSVFGGFGLPATGVKGVALSTTISKIIGLIILLFVLIKKVDREIKVKNLFPFPKIILINLLKIGIPSAGEEFMYDSSQLVITFFINLISNEALTTKSYVQSIVMFAFLFSVAIGQGTQILVGHLVGKKETEEAYKTCIRSLKIAVVTSILVSTFFAVFRIPLLSIFTKNPYILSVGGAVLIIDVFLEPGRAFNLVIIGSLKAAGDVTFPVLMGVISMWGVSVTLSYFIGIHLGFGIAGMWIAFALDEWIRGILMLWRWKSRKWEKMSFVKQKGIEVV